MRLVSGPNDPGSNLAFKIDLSRISLQCVRTIEPERGLGGHFHTFAVFLSTRTSTRCHCLLECGKGLLSSCLEKENPSVRSHSCN